MMITVHWCIFAAMLGFAMVGVITLGLQMMFAVWAKQGKYDKFERIK